MAGFHSTTSDALLHARGLSIFSEWGIGAWKKRTSAGSIRALFLVCNVILYIVEGPKFSGGQSPKFFQWVLIVFSW